MDRVSNSMNSCVGVIGIFLKGMNSSLNRFSLYKSLGVVNGNLLEVSLKVVEFL